MHNIYIYNYIYIVPHLPGEDLDILDDFGKSVSLPPGPPPPLPPPAMSSRLHTIDSARTVWARALTDLDTIESSSLVWVRTGPHTIENDR